MINNPAEKFKALIGDPVWPRDCWPWGGGASKGYGAFYVDGRTQLAHRISYQIFVGPIPKGMVVCHDCDRPDCVNPHHLFVGTQQDNVSDMRAKGRAMESNKERKVAKLALLRLRL
jgi:hypothetical protein